MGKDMDALGLMRDYLELEPYIMRKLEGLPKTLSYHNSVHTRDVIDSFGIIARVEGIKTGDRKYWLGKIGALLHDTGYLFEPVGKGHEERGAHFSENFLRNRGYRLSDIFAVSGMIRATTIPQNPRTPLEGMLCDADIDNFGRDDFFAKGKLLRQELESMGIKMSDIQWYEGTLKLLEGHKYHTGAARNLREGMKKENIRILKGKIDSLKK